MEKKIFPNFSQALLLVFVYLVIAGVNDAFWWITIDKTYSTEIIRSYINILILLLLGVFFFKKIGLEISEFFLVPDFLTILRFLVIIIIIRIVVTIPLNVPIQFINSLKEFKLLIFIPFSNKPIFFSFHFFSIIFAPIAEEIFYRGLILRQFLKQYSPLKAILLSSLLFSFYHLNLENSVFYFFMGIIIGIMYYKTHSLLLVIMAHILFNLISNFSSYEFVHLSTVHAVLFVLVYLTSIWTVVYLIRRPLIQNTRMGIDDDA